LSPAALRTEDLQKYEPDQTLNKIILAGLGGGLALIPALFYPLYVLLPGRYIDGWAAGSSALGLLSGIVAVLLAVATGLLAARWARADSRVSGTLFGALAGGVAGAVVFFGLGAAAAAVAGNAPLLAHGLGLAASEAEAVRLLSEAMIGITWGVCGAFWAALLTGVGLGAIGGLLLPSTEGAPARLDPRPVATSILISAGLLSALALCASLPVFSLLEGAIRRTSAEYALFLGTTLPVAGMSLWPIGTQLVLYLASLAALYALLRAEARSSDQVRLSAVLPQAVAIGLLTLAWIPYLWFVGQDSDLTPALRVLYVLTAAGNLALGGLYLALILQVYRRRQAMGLYYGSPIRFAAGVGVLVSLAALAWAVNASTLFSLMMAAVVIAASIALIIVLWRQREPSAAGVADLLRWQLSLSQTFSAGLGLVIAIVLPLVLLVSLVSSVLSITLQFPSSLFGAYVDGQLYVPRHALADLVREAYSTQATASSLTFVAASVVVGLLLAVISGRMALTRWRVSQDAEAGE
jgi:hypothetical protein